MAEQATATEAPAGPEATPPAQPAPAAAPTGSPETPAAQPTAGQPADEFVRVPRSQLDDHGGDYHEALRLAGIGRQAETANLGRFQALAETHGMSVDQLYEFITSEAAEPEKPAEEPPKPPEGADDTDRPLTLRDLEERDKRLAEEARQREEQQRQQETMDKAQAADQSYMTGLADELKLEGVQRDLAMGKLTIAGALVQAIEERLAKDVRVPASERHDRALAAVAMEADYARAKEIFSDAWTDLGNQFIAKGAKEQQGLPSQTLGGGRGGPMTPPEEYTPEAELEAIRADMKASRGIS